VRFCSGILLLFFAACIPSDHQEVTRSEFVEEAAESVLSRSAALSQEYEVIRTYLDTLRHYKIIFVLDTVALRPDDAALTSNYTTTNKDEFLAHRSALNQLSRVALESKKLDLAAFEDYPYVFASQDEVTRATDDPAGASPLGGIAGHTIVEASQVAFDVTNTVAILYVAHHCGMVCGVGLQIAYKKEQAKWIEMYRRELWVS
jgi:hypothetical protein